MKRRKKVPCGSLGAALAGGLGVARSAPLAAQAACEPSAATVSLPSAEASPAAPARREGPSPGRATLLSFLSTAGAWAAEPGSASGWLALEGGTAGAVYFPRSAVRDLVRVDDDVRRANESRAPTVWTGWHADEGAPTIVVSFPLWHAIAVPRRGTARRARPAPERAAVAPNRR